MKMHESKRDRNERIIGMYMEGYSHGMIASVLNIKRSIVTTVIMHHAKDKTDRQPVKYKVARKRNRSTEQESRVQTAKEMRAQGFSYEAIGKAMDVSRQRAHQLVNDYN